MAIYLTYALEVHTDEGWEIVEGTVASNRPHHYDVLRQEFNRLVRNAIPYKAYFVKEFGYRISREGRTVDLWEAHNG